VIGGDDDPVLPIANSLLLAQQLVDGRLIVAPAKGTCCSPIRRALHWRPCGSSSSPNDSEHVMPGRVPSRFPGKCLIGTWMVS
jgi:hypothetical protein